MTLYRNKLYSIIFTACLAGYIWLYLVFSKNLTDNKSFEVCLIKQITNIPCPSCGSTRSIISIIKGDYIGSLYINPMGIIIGIIMLLSPIWIIIDLTMRMNTLYVFYQKIEAYIQRQKVAIALILIAVVNWIWNISKGL